MELTQNNIKKAIIRSQHCQRNWDLSRDIPKEDLQLMIDAVTLCPSKQNTAFYNVYAITDRDTIEKIHAQTAGFYLADDKRTVTNSQVLANVLFVFTSNLDHSERVQVKQMEFGDESETVKRDLHMASGVAAGFVNLTATLLGYNTGCCACFDDAPIKEILNTEDEIVLLMGIGYKSDKPRRIHHADPTAVFPAIPKEEIKVIQI